MTQLRRSNKNRKLAGVIGGIANRFNINANILRLAFIIGLFVTGFFPLVFIYLILIYVMPNEV